MSVAILPHRQIVSSAASNSVRRCVTSTRMSVANGTRLRVLGSCIKVHDDKPAGQVLGNSQSVAGQDHERGCVQRHHLRPAEQPHPRRPFRDRAREQVGLESGVVQVIEEQGRTALDQFGGDPLLQLFGVCTARHGVRLTPEGDDAHAAGEQTLAGTGTRHGAARNSTPGARCRLGRQTAVSNAVRNADSSLPGGLLVSTWRRHPRHRPASRRQRSRTS